MGVTERREAEMEIENHQKPINLITVQLHTLRTSFALVCQPINWSRVLVNTDPEERKIPVCQYLFRWMGVYLVPESLDELKRVKESPRGISNLKPRRSGAAWPNRIMALKLFRLILSFPGWAINN